MKPNVKSKFENQCILLVASLQIAACAAVDEDAIQKRLDSSIGQRFQDSRWYYLDAEHGYLQESNALRRVYEFKWKNGCAYQVFVTKPDDIISGWRFTSSVELCKQVVHRPLGS